MRMTTAHRRKGATWIARTSVFRPRVNPLSFGVATTHWSKLADRVQRGAGKPCPLLSIGPPSSIVAFGEDKGVIAALLEEGAEDWRLDMFEI